MRTISRMRVIAIAAVAAAAGMACSAGPSASDPGSRNNLTTMETTTLTINGHRFTVWVARTWKERELGLMQVTTQEMAPLPDGSERGMLFVFEYEQPLEFWMKNTIIPLDIAYIRGDGQIVKTYTMAPMDTRLYPSMMPALTVLEVGAGVYNRLGIAPGDMVQIPESVLKPSGS